MSVYLMSKGDTPDRIAGRYGIPEKLLYEANDYFDTDYFRPGRRIYVPDHGYRGRHKYSDGIRFDIRLGRKRFRPGERVSINFSYCNLSNRSKRMRYDDARLFDFVCYRGGRDIWRWSDKRPYDRGGRSMLLAPGECRSFNGFWPLCDRRGASVSPGKYVLRGYDMSQELKNQYVDTTLSVVSLGEQINDLPENNVRTRLNLLANPNLDNWTDSNTLSAWSSQNIVRTSVRRSGKYAAAMGAWPSNQALLAQIINVNADSTYRVSFWAKDELGEGRSNFILEATLHALDSQKRQIGRVGPVFKPGAALGNEYKQFFFSSGALPKGTRALQLRFTYRPRTGNAGKVLLDEVELSCE